MSKFTRRGILLSNSHYHEQLSQTLIRITSSSNSTSRRFPFLPSLIFPLHLLPSPVHLTGFSFCFYPGFLAIFILLSSNSNIATLQFTATLHTQKSYKTMKKMYSFLINLKAINIPIVPRLITLTRLTRFYSQRNLFEILLYQTEIRLYLPCTLFNW